MSGLVVKSYDGRDARRVVAGMATDPAVCGRISTRWTKEGLFGSPEANLVGGWCVRHYRKFGRPPGKDLRAVFDSWAASRDGRDGKLVESVGRLLRAASDEREIDGEHDDGKVRGDFLLDMADRMFRREAIRRTIDAADADLEAGDVEAAESRLAGLRRIDLSSAPPVRPGLDRDFWRDVFDEERVRPLFEYPGPLATFMGSEFSRDSFVAVMAPAKRFKSWFLLDAAFRCLREHHRVAFFEAGDLSRRQVGKRMGQRALRKPNPGEADECRIPIGLPAEEGEPEWDVRRLEPITEVECFREWARLQRGCDLFRLSCHSNRSLSVAHVESTLREWALDGWSADAVVIDYADIMAPPAGIKEHRDQINETWMGLRRISQDHDCLVLTATQADAASYGQRLLRRHNFSDDRRKHDHVTAMIGINMTDEEKGWGVYRLNFLDRRESAYTETSQVRVAGCLKIGCPVLVSAW